jgi:hypothetical protein
MGQPSNVISPSFGPSSPAYNPSAVANIGIGGSTQVGGLNTWFIDPGVINPQGYAPTTINPPTAYLDVPSSFGSIGGSQAGFSTTGNSAGTAAGAKAAQSPWSPKASPLPWVIGLGLLAFAYFDFIRRDNRRGR